MYYAVTHLTDYAYNQPITDSVMELRMQPRSEGNQRCVRFNLEISPDARHLAHRDYLGNMIHTFDIPAKHTQLAIKTEAVVEVKPPPLLPDTLPDHAWTAIDEAVSDRDLFDMLLPGTYTHATPLLMELAQEIGWGAREVDPLTMLRQLNTTIYEKFAYEQDVTKVDSPIDVALQARSGVCQDFSHIMLTLVRQVGIPARYVSGYLFHREGSADRSFEDASHAWIEVWLPDLGWVGFDPTNNLIVENRHIRVCIANDYAKASPARGVFKGDAQTELSVQVQVTPLYELPLEDATIAPDIPMPRYGYHQQQQQQQ